MRKALIIAGLAIGLAGCASIPTPVHTPVSAPEVVSATPVVAPLAASKKPVLKAHKKAVAKKQDKAPVAQAASASAPVAAPAPVIVNKLGEPRWYDRFRKWEGK
ncbi:hypothetical protein [Bradyrhizobium sp. Ai1a-2]|uniref:hypothetical protein n=1 Tax=Bradyrhizobium sp. Ai1a-2 TaxID=196490 RepID=UPI00040EEB1B|nr:hypothetical protein [Bradyrhizobium sp. Ai1a-2]